MFYRTLKPVAKVVIELMQFFDLFHLPFLMPLTYFTNRILLQNKKAFPNTRKGFFIIIVNVLLHHIMPFPEIANHDDRNNNDINNNITKHKILFLIEATRWDCFLRVAIFF